MLGDRVDNAGERLVPGESYDRAEAVRHKSSYRLFRAVVEADLRAHGDGARILDLGCGVGHGTLMLADLPGTEIVGVDASADAIAYAREHYGAANVTYVAATAEEHLRDAGAFDYVVSRHALEHIPDGLRLALRFDWRRRLIVNVPYREPARDGAGEATNRFHELSDISEDHFADYPRAELLYEDLDGVTAATPDGANSIVCVASAPGLAPAADALTLPFPAWEPNRLEEIALDVCVRQSRTIEAQTGMLAQWEAAFAGQADAQRDEVASLQARFEERAALDEARLAELRAAYDELASRYAELRHSRAVASALRARGLLRRLRR